MNLPLMQQKHILIVYLKPQWTRATALTALLVANIGLQLVGPLLLRHFIDVAVARGTLEALSATALAYIIVALGGTVASAAETYVAEDIAWTTTNTLRADVALHCLHLDIAFHHAHTPGELIERVDGDVSMLSNLFSRFVIAVLGNALLLAGMLIILIRIDLRVGLVLAAYAMGGLLVLSRLNGIATPRFEAARQASADLFGYMEERLGSLEDIRASGASSYLLRRLTHFLRQRLEKERQAAVMGYTMWSFRAILFTLGTIIAFGLAAYFYKNGSMTIGTAYLIFNYTQRLLGPVNQISGQLSDFQRAAAGLSRVQQLLNTHPAIEEAPGKPLPIGALSVDVEHVSFGYRADELVLHDMSFHLAPQTVLGILGRTGSGKTTLTRLLFRFYDPDCGVLRLGGVDLRAARLGDVRTRVAVVTQEVLLFHATVRDNLTFFDPTVSDTTLLEALEELGLREWYVGLPDGLDTKLAVGSSGLSAGQAQLLALARVFLTDPGLVILDEASSRLDLATEALLDRAIGRLLRNRTGIIIAHRLTTVRRADEIMILEDGRISEYGPRAQLAADPTSRFCHLLRTGLTEAAQ